MRLPALRWVVAGGIFGLLLAALLVAEFQRPLNSDSAWLLHVADRVAQGDRLYVDLIEINPPLVVWLQIPIVSLAGRLGLDPISAFRIAVLAWIGLCLVLSARVLRSGTVRVRDRRWILLAIVMVALGWTRAHFGEREHIALVALLPYLFATAMAEHGRAPRPAIRMIVGLLAALGFTLKPHFLLVWIVCLLYIAWNRRTARSLLAVENLTILAFVIVYGLLIVVGVPEYVSMVSRLASTYDAFARKRLASLVLESAEALCAIGALFAYGLLRRSLRTREIGDVLALATGAFLLAVVVQRKGFSYHYYPVSGSTLLLAAVALIGREGFAGRAVEKVAVLTLSMLLLLAVGSGVSWSLIPLWREEPQYLQQRQMAEYIRGHAADGSVLRLGYEDNFPLIDQAGVRWAMRFPNLWFVQAAYAQQLASSPEPVYRAPPQMGVAERWCFEAVLDDFLRTHPSLLMIIQPHPRGVAGDITRMDYLKYFSQDPRFVAAFHTYEYIGVVEGYSVFQRPGSRQEAH